MVKLYYTVGSCSLISHVILIENKQNYELVKVGVDGKLQDGTSYTTINPKGFIPAIQLDDGQILTEAIAVNSYLADQKPETNLLPPLGDLNRYRVLEAYNVIYDLHKIYGPLFRPHLSDEQRVIYKDNVAKKYEYIEKQLEGRQFYGGNSFSIADVYLFVASFFWPSFAGVDLSSFKILENYLSRIHAIPSVQEALKVHGIK